MPMYCFDLNNPFNLRIDEIQSDEFVYFKLPLSPEKDSLTPLEEITEALTKQSSRVFLAASTYSTDFLQSLLKKYPLSWIGVKIEGLESLKKFSQDCSNFNMQAIPQLSNFKSADEMSAVILDLFKNYSLPFLFLEAEGEPDNSRVNFYKDVFSQLKKNNFEQKIYFTFSPHLEEWNLKTKNTFSGMTTVHVDLSNKCTHSCVFCGIWGPEFIEEAKAQSPEGILSEENISFMNRQMPFAKTEEILNSLPETVQKVQFGGAGDPLTHPQWFQILKRWRNRGFIVEVLTNFEYPSFEEIEKLHLLSKGIRNFSFLINVSAATAETYKTIRPRQSEDIFKKVISNIRYAHELRKRDGFGLSLTIVNIINSENYKEAVKMVELAHELGVGLWLKPLEVHSPLHLKYSIQEKNREDYKQTLKAASQKATELNVELSLEALLMDHINEENFYKTIPCTVGYTYARFETDGTARPCCITNQSMGNIFSSEPAHVWHGQSWNQWRENFYSIDINKKENAFCKMCPHIPLNQHAAKLIAKARA